MGPSDKALQFTHTKLRRRNIFIHERIPMRRILSENFRAYFYPENNVKNKLFMVFDFVVRKRKRKRDFARPGGLCFRNYEITFLCHGSSFSKQPEKYS